MKEPISLFLIGRELLDHLGKAQDVSTAFEINDKHCRIILKRHSKFTPSFMLAASC